jgi:preprotein translocase subunit SecA
VTPAVTVASAVTSETLEVIVNTIAKQIHDSKRKLRNERDWASDFLNVSVDRIEFEDAKNFILSGGSTLATVMASRHNDIKIMQAMLQILNPISA